MAAFPGFPPGYLKATPLPNLFFSELLPQIEHVAELKVTLHVFWMLHKKTGLRCVTLRELLSDGTLLSGLGAPSCPAEEAVSHGLALATARGTVLHLTVEIGERVDELYFLNNPDGRQTVAKLRSGVLDLGQTVLNASAPPSVVADQRNIFALYEQNIGLLTPLLAEELVEAENLYPAGWIEDAFKQALLYNKRNWHYVRRILERWAIEGRRNEETGGDPRRLADRAARYSGWGRSPERR